MVLLRAHELTLKSVHDRLGFVRGYAEGFEPLVLAALAESEVRELLDIRSQFDGLRPTGGHRYLVEGSVLESQVRLLAVNPLLRLSGFHQAPITIRVEEAIAPIDLPDSRITGRMDLLAIRKSQSLEQPDFWVLVVESKESGADAMQGLAQLLTDAYGSLAQQQTVWGLTTNGISYRFVQIEAGQPPRYWVMPELNLLDTRSAKQLLQVLKAICRL
jgi:hypothetical protein